MPQNLRFYLNDRLIEDERAQPTTTLLEYLREQLRLTGTKEGCAEGDCGACSVAILDAEAAGGASYRAVNACLVLLPMVQGRRVYTVEGLRQGGGALHPAQDAMVRELGSQCGYCTPGVVMSLFEACYRRDLREPWQLDDQLCGNLCRCTGYRPIR
ncbi:MAG: 2Fe-2S iron-sulfur cluster binding domain-containing protein, partial [Myxococcales bacterium]|nr:2Fe-2S iron-sulfur cluster binding domain-containing protein [Myxococcales bacterium]